MRRRQRTRGDAPRARTVAAKRLTADVRLRGWLDLGMTPDEAEAMHDTRPRTRGDCASVPRPCPYVSCRHHLYLDINPETGSIKFVFPTREPWEMPAEASCALDVADAGGHTLEAVGEIVNVTRERARQIEVSGASAVHETLSADGLDAGDVAFASASHPLGGFRSPRESVIAAKERFAPKQREIDAGRKR